VSEAPEPFPDMFHLPQPEAEAKPLPDTDLEKPPDLVEAAPEPNLKTMPEQVAVPIDQAITIRKCSTCGLELAGENAICVCDASLLVPAQDQMLGQTLGCYKIVEVIGRGGMGVIYRAHDQWMDRVIAIKMLHQHLVNDPMSLQRFNQEAKAAGNIEHPNVITAFDFGVQPETKQPYLVMEYLQGRSLSDVIEGDGQIESERAVNIFIQACDALATAHAKNVLHRDLKPSNIMLVHTKDEPDFVKIVDFGIAKMLPGSGKEVQLTQTGEVFGSPLYMSPEQFIGRKLDVRTDIYAMGCVMYEALMGKPPIVGEHVLETMYKHMNEAPKKFSEMRSDLKVSAKIEAVVLRALEKEADNRYQTMSEMRDDLLLTKAGFKDRRPLSVKMKAKWTNVRRFVKRYDDLLNNAALVALSVVIVCCLVGFVLMFFRTGQESQWRALKVDAQKAYSQEEFDVAKDKFEKAVKVAMDNFGEEDPRYIDTLKRLAWVCDAKGDYATGREIFKRVYKLNPEELTKIRLAQTALSFLDLVDKIMVEGVLKGPERGLRIASETIEKYLGSNDPELIPLLEKLALVYQGEEKYPEAETQYLRIFSIMRETEGDTSAGAAYAHKLLGSLYDEWAEYNESGETADERERRKAEYQEKARKEFQDSIDMYKEVYKDAKGEQAAKSQLLVKDVRALLDQVGKPKAKAPDKSQEVEVPQF
jgi:serine/threonine protein kinase